MKNALKVFNAWFWVWAVISAILVGIMLIVGNDNQRAVYGMAATIMALFMVMPVRNWLYRFVVWAINYVSSINTNFKDRINPVATYNLLIDPTKREENVGFYRSLKIVIGIIMVILALLWLVFQRTSFNIVYAFLHTWEFIFRGRISFLALLVYILLSLGFYYLVYWFIGQVLNGKLHNDTGKLDWSKALWRILLAVVGFYVKIIIGGALLRYTAEMILATVGFWTIVVAFLIAIFELWCYIRRRRAERNANP